MLHVVTPGEGSDLLPQKHICQLWPQAGLHRHLETHPRCPPAGRPSPSFHCISSFMPLLFKPSVVWV